MQRLSGVQILGNLTAQEYPGSSGNHRLTKIIVQILLRISFPGIERPNSFMNHVIASFFSVHPLDSGLSQR
jgi:hypothetical protein